MKKLIILLSLCFTTSTFGQFMPHQKPNLGWQVNGGHPLSKGLVYYGLFNEGSGGQVYDLSGNQSSYFGDFINSPTWTSGKYGSAIYFRGFPNDDYIKLRVWDGGPKITLFAIVRFDRAIADPEQITSADSSSAGHRTFQFSRNATGKLSFIPFVGGAAKTVTGLTTLTTGQYYAVAAVNDGSYSHVYVNGIEDNIPVASGAMDNDPAGWAIAARAEPTWGAVIEEMKGNIDCLYAWNRALTSSEVAQLYANPFCILKTDYTSLWQSALGNGNIVPILVNIANN